ncbi:MAG: YajQ family cyclic di-GMP-binding protein [Candidatus Omnitrophica bacterium]|nr:YajQ family cyclic di-GMP-binding protein [Candidatus Omnitrophota bacterium]
MPQDSSFDIVSKVDLQEVDNAVQQAMKEVLTRYDFKGSKCEITFNREEKKINMLADDEMKLRNLRDILATKLAKRSVSLKALKYGDEEEALGGAKRQSAEIVLGIPQDKAKEIVKKIKETKLKVQASIQGDQIRVSGKQKDDLQSVMHVIKDTPIDVPLQFVNYR